MRNVYSFEFEITKRITNCHKSTTLLTNCVRNFIDKEFGSNYDNLIEKSYNFTSMIFTGMDKLENITGCKECCNSLRYNINLVHSVKTKVKNKGWLCFPLDQEILQNTSKLKSHPPKKV